MLALIAGCAQLEWLRPDTEPATRAQDLAQCEQQASLSASRLSASKQVMTPSVSISPSGGAGVHIPPPYAPIDPALESDILTLCMHAKGYRLAPVKPAGAP